MIRAGAIGRRTRISGATMKSELSEYSTDTLLRMMHEDVDHVRDFNYRAQQCLFKRWRDGVDIDPLIELVQSEKSDDRMRGAYYVGEANPRSFRFAEAAVVLAEDRISYCRMIFVGYVLNSGLYNEVIGTALAKFMVDGHLAVRTATINWAVYTTDDRFDHFSRLVEAGTGTEGSGVWADRDFKRGLRALAIAEQLREGKTVAEIRKDVQGEDSFTFDDLQFFESRLKRYIERRKNKTTTGFMTSLTDFDEYEIGVLGEQYDNGGKLKSGI
jgi:hypothetical protein